MLRSTTFRSVIALVLAAWMPFCCCSLRGLLNACASCDSHDSSDSVRVVHAHSPEHGPACHGEHHDDGSIPADSDRPDDHDGAPCACGKHRVAAIGAEKISIELPAHALVCALPEWEVRSDPSCRAPAIDHADFALHKPVTTLLRLHCALTV